MPDIPDNFIVVRGGQSEMPAPGSIFSGSVGSSVEESAAGVPHGMIRWTTAGEIRAKGGTVSYEPEPAPNSATINRQHVHVTEAGGASSFGDVQTNPVPKRKRIGGPDYRDPPWST